MIVGIYQKSGPTAFHFLCGRRQEEVEETPQFVFLVKVASTPGL